jgi:hypothetical protein
MLVACLDCGKREYTQVSPLWFTCDKCLKRSFCSCCGDQQLKTQLQYGMCKRCIKQDQEKPMRFCDGCGEDYPLTHLIYVPMWDGAFCSRCAEMEENA